MKMKPHHSDVARASFYRKEPSYAQLECLPRPRTTPQSLVVWEVSTHITWRLMTRLDILWPKFRFPEKKMSSCRNSSPHNGRCRTRIPRLENWQLTSSFALSWEAWCVTRKSQNQICKEQRETHLARHATCIPATRTKEAPLTRLPPIPGNNLGMEGQCCSWRCPSKPGKPQEQLVKDWRGRSAGIPQPNKTEPAAPVTTIGYFHPQWRRVRGQICKTSTSRPATVGAQSGAAGPFSSAECLNYERKLNVTIPLAKWFTERKSWLRSHCRGRTNGRWTTMDRAESGE